jgi:hypothetical protein
MCVLGKDQSAGRPQRVRMLRGDGGPGKVLDQGALDGAQMFVPLRAGYDIANQGVKSYQAAEIGGRASSDRAVGVDHDSVAAKKT